MVLQTRASRLQGGAITKDSSYSSFCVLCNLMWDVLNIVPLGLPLRIRAGPCEQAPGAWKKLGINLRWVDGDTKATLFQKKMAGCLVTKCHAGLLTVPDATVMSKNHCKTQIGICVSLASKGSKGKLVQEGGNLPSLYTTVPNFTTMILGIEQEFSKYELRGKVHEAVILSCIWLQGIFRCHTLGLCQGSWFKINSAEEKAYSLQVINPGPSCCSVLTAVPQGSGDVKLGGGVYVP